MSYRVLFTAKAQSQLIQAVSWWSQHRSSKQAERWLEGFQTAVERLAANPFQHPIAHENDVHDFGYTIHQLLYGTGRTRTHRVLYRVTDDTIYIVAVRHVAQQDITPEDVE